MAYLCRTSLVRTPSVQTRVLQKHLQIQANFTFYLVSPEKSWSNSDDRVSWTQRWVFWTHSKLPCSRQNQRVLVLFILALRAYGTTLSYVLWETLGLEQLESEDEVIVLFVRYRNGALYLTVGPVTPNVSVWGQTYRSREISGSYFSKAYLAPTFRTNAVFFFLHIKTQSKILDFFPLVSLQNIILFSWCQNKKWLKCFGQELQIHFCLSFVFLHMCSKVTYVILTGRMNWQDTELQTVYTKTLTKAILENMPLIIVIQKKFLSYYF